MSAKTTVTSHTPGPGCKELTSLVWELVKGSNNSTAPILSAMRKHAPSLLRDLRAALAQVQP